MSKNSEVSSSAVFGYKQEGSIITCAYRDSSIISGHLIGLVENDGSINMRYHQINANGELMTGICNSTPEIMSNGKIRLHEKWQWTSGDLSKGTSVLEEI
ncbi:n-acetylglutamate synthase [Algibacter sp. L4_22]|uniref:n-acetylglutamate synthase n=1 Tax=Algibacter sp. L4_22 TaxID=2942477 RepID=UPI00201B590B|nr:n-acetylglutamate synthase [Algibacter sp. L4_22]MCL5127029.1 n-acetylglutamate synthase [Algibacter sp. L4_22]